MNSELAYEIFSGLKSYGYIKQKYIDKFELLEIENCKQIIKHLLEWENNALIKNKLHLILNFCNEQHDPKLILVLIWSAFSSGI